MGGEGSRRVASAALLVALAPWCAGCATEIHVRQAPTGAATPSGGLVQVRVFDNRSDRARDAVSQKDVATELVRVEGASETLVREGEEPRWSLAGLAPGPYVLRATRCVDQRGVAREGFRPVEVRLSVRERATTYADIVLEDPTNAWISIVAAAVLAYAIVYDVKANGMTGWWVTW